MTDIVKKHSVFEYIKLIFSIDKRLYFFVFYDTLTYLIYTLAPIGIVGYLSSVYLSDPSDYGFREVILILTIFTLIKVLMSGINMILRNELSNRSYRFINNWVIKSLYKKVQEIDYETYQSNDFLNIYQKACDEASDYMFNVFWNVDDFIGSFVSMLSIGVILSLINPIIIVYSILVGVITYFISHKRAKMVHLLGEKNMQNVRERAYVKRTFFLKDSAIDVKTTNISDMYLNLNDEIGSRVLVNIDKYAIKTNGLTAVNTILMRSIYIIALAFVTYTSIESQNITIVASLISAAVSLSELITDISENISNIKENIIHRGDYYRVMDQQAVIENSGTINELSEFENLEFRNVFFKYKAATKYSLDDVCLKINKGDKIAVVGENGAGKTTFIKLLLRLYDCEKGNIYFNNIDVKNIVPNTLRSQFVTVFQNYQIYSLTIAENILLRKVTSKEDEELVIDALKKVGLYEKVSSLKEGINTTLTKEFDKEGAELSGGERQKLVIARIFASKCKVLVLDEPNSALDPLAEKNIFDEIFKYAKDKTLIFISHRFSTTINADCIYLFDDGKIKEFGSHKELMSLDGEYKRMFNIQAEKYQSEVNE